MAYSRRNPLTPLADFKDAVVLISRLYFREGVFIKTNYRI